MSKAFTNEEANRSDTADSAPIDALPQGKNYMTPGGFKALQDEFRRLKSKERPEVVRVVEWAAGNGDRSENGDYIYGKKRLREIDRRLSYLAKRLDTAEVVDPVKINSQQVLFGATVTILTEDDQEKTWSIVGIDEADIAKRRISWISPIARALFKARVGDVVQVHSPKGVQELEVIEIKYSAIEVP